LSGLGAQFRAVFYFAKENNLPGATGNLPVLDNGEVQRTRIKSGKYNETYKGEGHEIGAPRDGGEATASRLKKKRPHKWAQPLRRL